MYQAEQNGCQENASYSRAEYDLRAAVEITLERILLKQRPQWNQQESRSHELHDKVRPGNKPDNSNYHPQNTQGGEYKQAHRGKEVVEAKPKFPRTFIMSSVRNKHQYQGGEHWHNY